MAANPEYYPADASLDVPLHFNSFADVQEWLNNERPTKTVITDPSYPALPAQQRMWVKAILTALYGQEDVIDGEKLLKQWETMVLDLPINIEFTAWKFLMRVMSYHNLEGRLDPLNPETQRAKIWDSFTDHMKYILGEFKNKKTLCRHLATDNWTSAFIDAPEMHSQRVVSNRRINNAKKSKVDANKTALKEMKDLIGSADLTLEGSKEQLLKGVDDIATRNSTIKKEDEETIVPGQATVQTTTRAAAKAATATPRKKSLKLKLIPKSKKVSLKRKSSNADEDNDETYADPLGSSNTLVGSSPPYHLGKEASYVPLPQYQGNVVEGADSMDHYQDFSCASWNNHNELTEPNGTGKQFTQNGGTFGYAPEDYQETTRAPMSQGWQTNATRSTMRDTYNVSGYSYTFMDSDNENTNPTTPYYSQSTDATTTKLEPMICSPMFYDRPWDRSQIHNYRTGNPTIDPSLLCAHRSNYQADSYASHAPDSAGWTGTAPSNNPSGGYSRSCPVEEYPLPSMGFDGSSYSWAAR